MHDVVVVLTGSIYYYFFIHIFKISIDNMAAVIGTNEVKEPSKEPQKVDQEGKPLDSEVRLAIKISDSDIQPLQVGRESSITWMTE